ncbi:MAG: Asp-tRNA(Asn)/Glu-tRNA(Gln) amidotransferase subunit GatB [Bacteroidetes bacterium]|nr:MAG: Asp-tRNA(Asn)/Glu-tRNA(Gln) amidotransferase subunit GatB [Bacteroidota bacterium]
MAAHLIPYEPVIGLEVHIQLLTGSKFFSTEGFAFAAPPNHFVSPVTMAHPGALPSVNAECISHALTIGLATHCHIQRSCFFDRKNYFYPDLPKGYQLTQDRKPLCLDGYLEVPMPDGSLQRIRIQRIHMEEDAGKLLHDQEDKRSYVDLNRAGVGLVELVTYPDIRSAEEAGAMLAEIRRLVRYLGICDGNMEEGSLRCDANVSVRPAGEEKLGTRTEIKNLNSISFLVKAIQYETARQIREIGEGNQIRQETRTWDAARQITLPMREKESADDYRYFPEPDLQPLLIPQETLDQIRKTLPTLPAERFSDYHHRLKLSYNEALTLADQRSFSDYFETLRTLCSDEKSAANWMLGPVRTWLNEAGADIEAFPVPAAHFAAMLQMVSDGGISLHIAREQLFPAMLESPATPPAELAAKLGLLGSNGGDQLKEVIMSVMAEHPEEVARFRGGKKALMGFFVGQVMRKAQGKADPQQVNQWVADALSQP